MPIIGYYCEGLDGPGEALPGKWTEYPVDDEDIGYIGTLDGTYVNLKEKCDEKRSEDSSCYLAGHGYTSISGKRFETKNPHEPHGMKYETQVSLQVRCYDVYGCCQQRWCFQEAYCRLGPPPSYD